MLPYVRENIQFTGLVFLWLFSGAYLGSAAIAVVGASFFLLTVRGYYAEILIGFWFILMFSDSMLSTLLFAQATKKVLIVMLLLILFLQRKVLITNRNEIFGVFIPFFLWSILILYDNPRVALSLQKTASYILLFLIIPVLTRYVLERDQRAFHRMLVFCMTVYLTVGILMRYYDFDMVYLEGRFRGFMGNPNGLGVLVFLFALLYDSLNRKDPFALLRWQKVLVWAIIFLNLFYCQSRSAFLAVILYMGFSSFRILRGFPGMLVFSAILFSYQYIVTNLPLIISTLGLEEQFRLDTLEGGSGRLIAWTFTWEQIQDNFFVGRGFTYTDWIFWQNYDLLTNMGHLGNAHNSFLTFWLDTGLIGFILYMIAFFLVFYRTAKVYINAIPVMYAVIFSANFESWLTASLNPNTITLLMTLTVMLYGRDVIDYDGTFSDEPLELSHAA